MTTPSLYSLSSEAPDTSYHQAGRTSIDHLLSRSHTPNESKLPYHGPRKSMFRAALLPLATVLLWSFGMGSTLLVWLFIRRIPPVPGVSTNIFDGYLIVDEGNKTGSTQMLDGQEGMESSMRGVLIITAISHFSSMAVVPLMALGAFYVAAQWLDDQANSKDGPTPLQFGLVMQMCSMGTWDSVLATLKYLFRHWMTKSNARTRVSPIVHHTLAIAGIVVLLHYAVKATDLWLTAGIGSVYYSTSSVVDITKSDIVSALGTRYKSSITPNQYGYSIVYDDAELDWTNLTTPTNAGYAPGGNRSYFFNGLDALNGISTMNHIAMVNVSQSPFLQDTLSMAVIVRPPSTIPPQWSWTAPTMGISARCRPAPCDSGGSKDIICPKPSDTYPSMPLPNYPYMSAPLSPRINNASGYNDTSGEWFPNYFQLGWALPPAQQNPSYIVMQLHLDSPRRDPSELGRIRLQEGAFSFYLGTCEISFYDVEVTFTGSPAISDNTAKKDADSQYSLASPPIPMPLNVTTRLFSPVVYTCEPTPHSLLNYTVMQLLANSVRIDTISPGFSDRVAAELARLTLGLISSMGETIPGTTVTDNSAKLVSRYPMAGTLSYMAVVYGHGFVAIILFIGIMGRSSDSIVVDDPGWRVNWRGVPVQEKQKPAGELLLVHLRLTDPLALVAEHFSEPDVDEKKGMTSDWSSSGTYTSTGTLSTRKDPIEMFGVENNDTMRVEVGLMDNREGERRFGLNHRKGRLVENPDSRNDSRNTSKA